MIELNVSNLMVRCNIQRATAQRFINKCPSERDVILFISDCDYLNERGLPKSAKVYRRKGHMITLHELCGRCDVKRATIRVWLNLFECGRLTWDELNRKTNGAYEVEGISDEWKCLSDTPRTDNLYKMIGDDPVELPEDEVLPGAPKNEE